MFRHQNPSSEKDADKEESEDRTEDKDKKKQEDSPASSLEKIKPTSSKDEIRELLEKNLKWSQIIYEQNRKINHKLAYAAIAGWLRLLIILVPLVLALLYLPPIMKQVWGQYSGLGLLMEGSGANNSTTTSRSLESLIKILNLSPTSQDQIKNLIK